MIPQKALHFYIEADKKKPKFQDQSYSIMEKYDGWYGFHDSGLPIKSRADRAIPSLRNLSTLLNEKVSRKGRLIFEILVSGVSEFSELNGLLNRTVGDCECKKAYLAVHDFIPNWCINTPFYSRYNYCLDIVSKIDSPAVCIAPILHISNLQTAWKEQAEKVWARGGEGIILKRSNACYTPGARNHDLMKIKEEIELDLLVIGVEGGEGKYLGTTGALRCKSTKGEHSVSGMTDQERNFWWDNPEEIIGKVIKVKAMKINPDGSIREPRYICIRHDKLPGDID